MADERGGDCHVCHSRADEPHDDHRLKFVELLELGNDAARNGCC
jgi:hypothetical protein